MSPRCFSGFRLANVVRWIQQPEVSGSSSRAYSAAHSCGGRTCSRSGSGAYSRLYGGCLWWMCLVGSGSRTTWLAILVAAIVAGYSWYGRPTLGSFAGLHGTCRRGSLGWLCSRDFPRCWVWPGPIRYRAIGSLASVGTREFLWTRAVSDAATHPILGIGPMHFAYSYNDIAAHPHNFWLQLAGEWGLAGCVNRRRCCLGRDLSGLTIRPQRQRRKIDKSACVGLATAMVVWAVGTQADGFMVVPTSQLMSLRDFSFDAVLAALTQCRWLAEQPRVTDLASARVHGADGRGPARVGGLAGK